VVFYDNIDHWLAHGFHRIGAAEKAGLTRIEAEIRPGSLADAQWYSFGVNKTHGLRRSNEDKRRAVEAALSHEKGEKLSDHGIAEHCGVIQEFVSKVRKSSQSPENSSRVTKRIGRDGKEYDISKIQEANKKRTKKTTTSTQTTTTQIEDEPSAVEDYEEVQVLEPTTDGLGRPVPEALDPAFRLVTAGFDAIRNKVIAARTAWNELQAELEPHPWVSRNQDFCQV
jgi:hypothetical protein